jgi:hypothetical protein
MALVRIVVLALGLIEGAWMTFDGTRALSVGDYVTPSSGAHAGELGPWHHIVSAVGIPPRSTAMKLIFVAYGIGWLVITSACARGAAWGWLAMLVASVATLWYLPVGTVFGLVQIGALIWLRRTTS